MWIYGWKLTTMPCLMVIGLVQPWETSNIYYVLWLYKTVIEGSSNFEWELFIAYHQHLANFGEHGYCGSRDMFCFFCFFSIKTFITITMYKQTIYSQQKLIIDIMFLVYYVIKQDLIIKGSGHYNNRSPSR